MNDGSDTAGVAVPPPLLFAGAHRAYRDTVPRWF
jgi:hypothetical protein